MERLSDTTNLLDAAREYAGLGLPIIPVRGKVPAVRGWQQCTRPADHVIDR